MISGIRAGAKTQPLQVLMDLRLSHLSAAKVEDRKSKQLQREQNAEEEEEEEEEVLKEFWGSKRTDRHVFLLHENNKRDMQKINSGYYRR